MHILTVRSDKSESVDYEKACPYNRVNICIASLTSLLLDEQRKADCCNTENYDGCPIFLAKILRQS